MTQRFAQTAGRLAGMTGRALGWRPDEFWQTTPTELAAILSYPVDRISAPLSRDDLRRLMEQDHD